MLSTKHSSPSRSTLRSTISPIVDRLFFAFIGFFFALLLSFILSNLEKPNTILTSIKQLAQNYQVLDNQTNTYNDSSLSFTIDEPITDWDAKRTQWLKHHHSSPDQVIMVTGSQHKPCRHPLGDHLLLRFLKNKEDYCRIQDFKLFYNTAILHPKMKGCWAKIPAIRAAMIAHPEAEWIWWMDSDAAFTDMSFRPPFDNYTTFQVIIPGWPFMVYEDKNWVGLNAGVFIVRNSQWVLNFLDDWAEMGPKSSEHEKWGKIMAEEIKGKTTPDADDQAALVYLLVKNKENWRGIVHLESSYDLHGYWEMLMKNLTSLVDDEDGSWDSGLWKRWPETMRRPFVTHFTGCQPCSGWHSPAYTWEGCLEAMRQALNLGDDQVLREFGFGRTGFNDDDEVKSLKF